MTNNAPLCVSFGLLSVLQMCRLPHWLGERCLPFMKKAQVVLLDRIIITREDEIAGTKGVFCVTQSRLINCKNTVTFS